MTKLLLIGLGGGLGAVLRHVIGSACLRLVGGSFPASTMIVNVSGCLLFGVLAALFAGPHALREELRGVLLIGLLGGYTTYSTFAWQTFNLADDCLLLLVHVIDVCTGALCRLHTVFRTC